jgi:osmotically-inducible protein OsmY
LRIDVDSRDGVVSLTGQADDEANRRRAEQVARAHKSVIGVRNNLTVNPL